MSRADIADYVGTVCTVYTILIFAYVITSFLFALGVRLPYSRVTDAILGFLRDTCEPYLRIFRRFIPPLGPIDITPIVAVFVLQIVCGIVVSVIEG